MQDVNKWIAALLAAIVVVIGLPIAMQSFPENLPGSYVRVSGDTMSGALDVNAEIEGNTIDIKSGGTINGDVSTNGTWTMSGTLTAATGGAFYVLASDDATAEQKAHANAICDGTADEVELQAANDAVKTNGGTVLLAGHTFYTSGTWTASPKTTWIGLGMGNTENGGATRIVRAGSSTAVMFKGDTTVSQSARYGIELVNIEFDGAGVASSGIDWTDYSNSILRTGGCFDMASYGAVISGTAGWQNTAYDWKCNNNGDDGWQIENEKTKLYHCYGVGNTGYGADINDTDCGIFGGDWESNGIAGIRAVGDRATITDGCSIVTNGAGGIDLAGSDASWVEGNYINNNTGQGIRIYSTASDAADGNHILNNDIGSNSLFGLTEADGGAGTPSACVIIGNRFYSNTSGAVSKLTRSENRYWANEGYTDQYLMDDGESLATGLDDDDYYSLYGVDNDTNALTEVARVDGNAEPRFYFTKPLSGGSWVEATISGSAIAVAGFTMDVDTEGDAATDNLLNITGGRAGDVILLRAENDGRDVVVIDGGGGNIRLQGNRTLDDGQDMLMLAYDGSRWLEVAFSSNN